MTDDAPPSLPAALAHMVAVYREECVADVDQPKVIRDAVAALNAGNALAASLPLTPLEAAVLDAWRETENPGHSDLDNEQPIALTVRTTLGALRALALRAAGETR